MKFRSEPVLKYNVTIDFGVSITGPENPVAKRASLRRYLARQASQKRHPQPATEVEYFVLLK